MSNDLYRQEILEHYRHPQNFGRLKKPNFQAYKINPLCGDEIDLQISTDKSGRIKDVRFAGSGCALSIASSSLLTESLKGKSFSQLRKLKENQVIKSLSGKISPSRRKCVLLPFEALREILNQLNSPLKVRGARGVIKRG